MGDSFDLTGTNLDLIGKVLWGTTELTIESATSEKLTLKIPSTLEGQTGIQTKALTGTYGTPAQTLSIGNYRIDVTPLQAAVPTAASVVPADGGSASPYKFFLGKTVTVTGENLTLVTALKIGGLSATVIGTTTDTKLTFTVPDGFTFTTATDCKIDVTYGNNLTTDFGTVKVYPFYFYPNIQIGLGSNSSSTYTDYARQHAFLLCNSGEVISADTWYDNATDAFAKTGSNALITAANTLTLTAEHPASDYYSVKPYLFFTASSSHKLAMNSPANSSSQLKCHFRTDSKTALPSAFGTPLLYFSVLLSTSDTEKAWADKVKAGTLTDLITYDQLGGSAAPAFAASESSTSTWTAGSVIAVQYVSAAKGVKPTLLTDLYQMGFMYVKEVTCGDAATGLALTTREGYIKFDFYWSKPINN